MGIVHKDLKGRMMAEPTSTTGGSVLIYKLLIASLPISTSVLAFFLGMRFVPLRKGHERKDVINRVMAGLASAFLLGVPCLVLLYGKWPAAFVHAGDLVELAAMPRIAGFFILAGCVQMICAIPGPWIVSAVFLYLERRKGKDIKELIDELKTNEAIDLAASKIADGQRLIQVTTKPQAIKYPRIQLQKGEKNE